MAGRSFTCSSAYKWLTVLLSSAVLIAVLPASVGDQRAGIAQAAALHSALTAPRSADQPTSTTAPASALSISHIQSAYTTADAVSGALIITFTVTNNEQPVLTPQVSASASATDTVAAAAAIDYTKDPNVIHDVILTDALLSSGAFVAAAPTPDRRAAQMTWNLGNIPPQGSVTATLTLQAPASAVDFTALDTGAGAWGMLRGAPVSASASPASLAPDTIDGAPSGEWLLSTPDANTSDSYMLAEVAQLGQDPLREFSYVQSLGYESYTGSLRGTRGTLWSGAGNSLDKASLLIAMLRASGIPSRYRHGTLATAQAQQLILSMFPASTREVGQVPAGAPASDPANDSKFLAETQDHWWVEAYLPGQGWQDLDPSFANAAVGQSFMQSVATDGTDRIAEVPDSLRTKVTMRVKVETYAPLVFYASGLTDSYPLSHTFNTVDLIGQPVTLQHLVNSSTTAGFFFYTVQNTYTPYLVVNGQIIQGQPYQDLISNFPLGTTRVSAEWLDFSVRNPDGSTFSSERTIVDAIGFAHRQGIGVIPTNALSGTAPLISPESSYSTLFAPSSVPVSALTAQYQQLAQAITNGQQAQSLITSLSNNGQIDPQLPAFQQAEGTLQQVGRLSQQANLLTFAALSDYATNRLGAGFLIHPYEDSPRILMTSWERNDSTNTNAVLFDLRRDEVRPAVYPGQGYPALVGFNYARGLMEMSLESSLLGQMTGLTPIGVGAVFQQAQQQGIALTTIFPQNLGALAALPLSDDAKARISEELQQPGYIAVLPSQPPLVNGQPMTGWLLINTLTGQTSDEMESGQHQDAVEYEYLLDNPINQASIAIIGFFHGFAVYSLAFVAFVLEKLPLGVSGPDSLKEVWQQASEEATAFTEQVAEEISKVKEIVEACDFTDSAGPALTLLDDYVNGVGFSAKVSVTIGVSLPENALTKCAGGLGLPTGITFASGEVTIELKGGGFVQGADYAKTLIDGMVDPPLSDVLLGPLSAPAVDPVRVSGLVPVAATEAGSSIDATLTVTGAQVDGNLLGQWTTDGQNTLAITGTTPLSGTLLATNGTPLGSGAITVQPAAASAQATTSGGSLDYALSAQGSAAIYAAALSGLGAGSNWSMYSAQLSATQPYSLALQNVVATVNGTSTYTGSFTLQTADTPTLMGSGSTAVPSFAGTVDLQAQNASLSLGPASGTAQDGTAVLDTSNGLALTGYTGPITVSSVSATTERVNLAGNGSFFTLHTQPASTTTAPPAPITFMAAIDANTNDTYTLTVEAPEGWQIALDATGLVTVTPPLGATPGTYALTVTAQSGAHPQTLASTVETVTITPVQGLALDVTPDPLTTVPWGPLAPDAIPGDTNSGQVQLTDAAFTIDVTNTSTVSHTFDLSVSGLPAGWTILSGAPGQASTAITLPAGGVGQIGLYISPTVTMLPPAGTVESFAVHAQAADSSGLEQDASQIFTVPAIAFSHVEANPAVVFSSPGGSTSFDLGVSNVGNTSGSFPLDVTEPVSGWTAAITSPLSLNAGQTTTQTVTLQTPGGTPGQDYIVQINAPAGGYTQTATLDVQLVDPTALSVDQAAQTATLLFPDNLQLGFGLQYLGQSIESLQTGCAGATALELPGQGTCNTNLVATVVSAAQQVAQSAGGTCATAAGSGITQAAQSLSSDTTLSEVTTDLASLQAAVAALQVQLVDAAAHCALLSLNPGRQVVLQNSAGVFNLVLTNQGTMTTTYGLTLTASDPSVALTPSTARETLAPGAYVTLPVTATPAALGSFSVQASAAAEGVSDLAPVQAQAGLTAVDAFLRVIGVQASPAYVEYGPDGTAPLVTAQVANIANEPFSATAFVQLLDAHGTQVYQASQPVQINSTLAPINLSLGTINTTGLLTGTYTVTVELLDQNGLVIPQASGQTTLGIGQAVQASSGVTPELVAPGNVHVTSAITTQLDPAMFSLQPVVTATATPGPSPTPGATSVLNVSVGYADTLRANPNVPVPWSGSPNTIFLGNHETYDSGAIRLDNTTPNTVSVTGVVARVPFWTTNSSPYKGDPHAANLWGSFNIPPHYSAILAQTNGENFDTSDFGPQPCGVAASPTNNPPTIQITLADGTQSVVTDTGHILDTGGFDAVCLGNESLQWRQIGTAGITNTAATLTLLPPVGTGFIGAPYTVTASLVDASQAPLPNVPVSFKVLSGPNAGLTGQGATDANGLATFVYTGTLTGTDSVQATVTNVSGGSFTSAPATVNWKNSLYVLTIDHSVPVTGVTILANTLAPPASAVTNGALSTDVQWQQAISVTAPLTVSTFQASLPAMQAGEVRQVANDTVINYSGAGGSGTLRLGPLAVAAAHLIAITPPVQTVGLGGQTVYTVTLSNPTQSSLTLTPTVTGLPSGWATTLGPVTLPGDSQVNVLLNVTVPDSAGLTAIGAYQIGVVVQTDSGGQDQATADLTVIDPFDLSVTPSLQAGFDGDVLVYTATISNDELVNRSYTLSSPDLAPNAVSFPSRVSVPAGQSASVPFSVTVHGALGATPFTVQATDATASRGAGAVLDVLGARSVAATLAPAQAQGGPGVPVVYDLAVTNTGTLSDTYSFNVALPDGWSYQLMANGVLVTTLSLPAYVLNSTTLWLIVTPSTSAAPGDSAIGVTVQSLNNPTVSANPSATLTVTSYGVQVAFQPTNTTMAPTDTKTWQVAVTNTGTLPDTYTLQASGIVSASAQFTPATVSLGPGQSQTVQLTAGPMPFVLPQTYGFGVTAVSQANPAIENAATADITFSGYRGVDVALQPASQELSNTVQTAYVMVVTNTGNLDTTYHFTPSSSPDGLSLTPQVSDLEIPAHMSSGVLLSVVGHVAGTFTLTGTATSTDGTVSGSGRATLIIDPSAISVATALTYTGATSGDYDDPATLGATLINAATDQPVSGAPISFTLGQQTCTGTTDNAGAASCAITPVVAAGTYTVTATFAGDGGHQASNASSVFTVMQEETSLSYTGPITIGTAPSGTVLLSAVLKEDGSIPIKGEPIQLTLGATSCTGTTDTSGTAHCLVTPASLGPQTVLAQFVGDSYYQPALSSSPVIIFAYLAAGSFVLGDLSVSAALSATSPVTLTWWGAQWSNANLLSGGAAPSAFKGFATSLSATPATCGGSWTSTPGNSPPPPSAVPGYVAVIVASKIIQTGSTIDSGNIPEIVIVKTNPGYSPPASIGDPGHPGTGTVVGVLCHS